MKSQITRWSPKISNQQKVSAEHTKFIFEQAEKFLKDSIETGALIVARLNVLINILSGIIVGIVAFLIAQWQKTHTSDQIFITSVVGASYLFLVSIFAVWNIKPYTYKINGSLPVDLFSDRFFQTSIPDADIIKHLYISEMSNYQLRIEENCLLNRGRWRLYKFTLWAFLLTPIIIAITYVIQVYP